MSRHIIATLFGAAVPTADRYSDWVEVGGALAINIHLVMPSTGTPVGAFKIHFSNDPVCFTEKQRVVGAASDGTQGQTVARGASSAANFIDVSASIGAGNIVGTGLAVSSANNTIILIETPPRFIRVFYNRTSGGTAGRLDGWLSGS